MKLFDVNDKNFELQVQIVAALATVIDPELNVNIIDLGMVCHVSIKEDNTIAVKMTLSTKHCPMGAAIVTSVEACLAASFPNYTAQVNLVWEPAWTTNCITKSGREQLEI